MQATAVLLVADFMGNGEGRSKTDVFVDITASGRIAHTSHWSQT